MTKASEPRSNPSRRRFALVVADAGEPDAAPLINRLRSFLKTAGRAFRIRAVRIVEIDADGHEIGLGEKTTTIELTNQRGGTSAPDLNNNQNEGTR